MPTEDSYTQQVNVFGRYLLDTQPNAQQIALYAKVLERQKADSQATSAMLRYAEHHAWSIPYLDAYCAVFRPESELRRRLFILFAILEAQPDPRSKFVPQARAAWYILPIGLRSVWATFKILLGLLLVSLARLKT